MKWAAMAVVVGVAWYTTNIARNQWRDGNKGGALTIGLLVLAVLGVPLWTLFFNA